MAKINFCGDSFCAEACSQSWTTQLATALNAKIVGLGGGGHAHERAIKTFDPSADYTVFCWTEPHRLYHPDVPIGVGTCDHYKKAKKSNNLIAAAYVYYKYLHNWELAEERYVRELYWFDKTVLSNYKGKVVHLFCFEFFYEFENGVTFSKPLQYREVLPQEKR